MRRTYLRVFPSKENRPDASVPYRMMMCLIPKDACRVELNVEGEGEVEGGLPPNNDTITFLV